MNSSLCFIIKIFRDRFDIILEKSLSGVAELRYTILYGKVTFKFAGEGKFDVLIVVDQPIENKDLRIFVEPGLSDVNYRSDLQE